MLIGISRTRTGLESSLQFNGHMVFCMGLNTVVATGLPNQYRKGLHNNNCQCANHLNYCIITFPFFLFYFILVDSQSGGIIAVNVTGSVMLMCVCIFALLAICIHVNRLHRNSHMGSMYHDRPLDELPPRLRVQAGKGDRCYRSSQRVMKSCHRHHIFLTVISLDIPSCRFVLM